MTEDTTLILLTTGEYSDFRVTDQELVDLLCDIEEGLSHWEMNFVDDLSKWLDTHDSLTDNQRKKAMEVYDARV